MKIFTILFTILAIASIAFSITKIDMNDPFQGDSIIALIMIMGTLCALALVFILMTSKKIQEKQKNKR